MYKLCECWRWCISSCTRRKNRIYPANPVQIIRCGERSSEDDPSFGNNGPQGGGGGQLNPSFQPDEDTPSNHVDTSIFNVNSTGGDEEEDVISEHPNPFANIQTLGEPKSFTSHFLELGKNKRIHVFHIPRPGDPEEVIKDQEEVEEAVLDISDLVDSGTSDDEEDEFWFSKWSKRPKLKGNKSGGGGMVNGRVNGRVKPKFVLGPADKQAFKELIFGTPSKKSAEEAESEGYTNLAFQGDQTELEDIGVPTENGLVNGGGGGEGGGSSPSHAKTEEQCQNNLEPNNSRINTIIQDRRLPQEDPEVRSDENLAQIPPGGGEEEEFQPQIPQNLNPNAKPILFFIHGMGGSCDIWKSQFVLFERLGYEIIAPDLLGHGLSSTPMQPKLYLFESLVQDLLDIFDHFITEEEERRVILIGHAYGACLATVLSRIRQKNIKLLISISGGGPTPLMSKEPEVNWIPSKLKKRKIYKGRFDNPELRNVIPSKIRENMLRGQIWLEGDSAFHRRIAIPTLLVYGLRDKVVNLVEECEMERTIPRSFLELLPNSGHMVMWDEPRKLNRMLYKFITSF